MSEPFDWALVRQAVEKCEGGVPKDWLLVLPDGTSEVIREMAEELVHRQVEIGDVDVPMFMPWNVSKRKGEYPVPVLTPAKAALRDRLESEFGMHVTTDSLNRVVALVLSILSPDDIRQMDVALYQAFRERLLLPQSYPPINQQNYPINNQMYPINTNRTGPPVNPTWGSYASASGPSQIINPAARQALQESADKVSGGISGGISDEVLSKLIDRDELCHCAMCQARKQLIPPSPAHGSKPEDEAQHQ